MMYKPSNQQPLRISGLAAYQQGMTMLEILIASFLGLFLIGGIISVFNSNQQTYSMVSAVAGIQENGRFAIDVISRDLRMAGFQGCADPDGQYEVEMEDKTGSANLAPASNFNLSAVKGYEYNGTVLAPAATGEAYVANSIAAHPPKANSDVLSVMHANAGVMLSSATTSLTPATFTVSNSTPYTLAELFPNAGSSLNQLAVIADCQTSELIAISSVSEPSTIVPVSLAGLGTSLAKKYIVGSRIMPFAANLYYVADTGRVDAQGNAIPGLFSNDYNDNDQELVQDVEYLQVLYGELNGNNIRFVPANTAGLNFENVVAVKIGILVRSEFPVLTNDDTAIYSLPGLQIGPVSGSTAVQYPNDRRLRRVFTATIKLRNRLQGT